MPTLRVVSTPSSGPEGRASAASQKLRARFDSGGTRPISWRLSQLAALDHLLMEREPDLLDALHADLRKPDMEAFISEIGATRSALRLARKKLASWMKPERVPTSIIAMPGRSYIYREPLGVTLIIGAWNYPFHLLSLPLIGALAAGNCVALKPSEVSSRVSAFLARWIPKYLDPSAVQVLEGGVPETTALLRESWDHIFYTGNGHVARLVMEAAAKHLTPVTLELGGKSPCIVDQSADLDLAARRIVYGKFFNAGQTCVAPDYVLVHERVHDALLNRMISAVRQFYGDDPKESPDFARIVDERHHARLSRLLDQADLATGGQCDPADLYIAPTILKNVHEGDAVMKEEIFGPILPVMSATGIEWAVDFVARHEKPLALYLFARDRDVQDMVLARTSSGGAVINHIWLHLGVPRLPFGGVGESGMGAYHGRHSFETFSHRRAVLKKPMLPELPFLFPPYSPRTLRWLKKLF